jgi:hypothetical protein
MAGRLLQDDGVALDLGHHARSDTIADTQDAPSDDRETPLL